MDGGVTKLNAAIEELERRMIREALQESEGNIAQAARELGLSRKGLYLKLERLNFIVPSTQTPQSRIADVSDEADPVLESPLS